MVTSAFVFIGFVFSSLLLVLGGCGASLAAGYVISGEEIGDRGFISHAFVQTDSELHYFRDVSSQEIAHVNKSPEIKSSVDQPLQLEPNKLVFEESSLGLPKRAVVSLFNPNEEPILINAISSKTLDFYFSFPENKLIKPLGKSRFVVTYLPRKEGAAEAKLTLHTSAGVVEYEARLPVNGTFEFPIVLHNPHADKLRLINAFSSDSELTLVHRKHDNVQLELAPFETVDFAQAIAVGATERNATVFVVLKLDAIPFSARLPKRRVVLIMAVDLEVTSQPGLFSTVDVLDFGLIKYGERSQRLVFRTYSTVEKGLEIDSVYVDRTSHQSNGVYLQFASKPPISVKSRTKNQPGVPVPISNIEIDTAYLSLNHSKKMHLVEGQIVAESRGGNFNATVRFQATVFLGDILSSTKDAVFHHSLRPPIRRSISVQNNYPFGLAVWNVSMLESKKRYFEVSTIRPVVEIAAGKSSPIITSKRAPVNFTVSCFVHTNVTTFEIPFLIFRGDIKVTINSLENDNSKFDFGLVKPNTERQMFFTVTNPNLVAIVLRGLSDPHESLAKIEPIGTEYGNGTMLSDLNRAFKPHNWTPALPIVYGLANSTLSFVDQQLHLGDSAPGKVSTKEIRVFNSFKKDLKVLRVSKLTTDKRFFFNLKTKGDLWLKSGAVTTLGNLSFAPGLTCGASCYVGLPLHTDGGQWFKHGLKLPPDLPDIDSHLYDRLRRRFNALESKTIRTSVIVDTDEVKSLEIGVQTELTWPRLLNHPVVHFPLTAVGNFTILNLTLHNPSVHPVVVQLLPLVVYPGAKGTAGAPVEMNETLMFSLRDTELFTLKPGSPVPRLREQLEDVVGGSVPRFTLSMLLQPGMSTRVRVGFLPTDYTLRSSLLLIRNNLTAIEPVVMYGKGAHRTFVVKNTGEVNFSIVNVSISGSNCEDRGFRVLNCQPFSLGPNETHSLEIA
ncbi:hypothetical protein M3Y99_00399100 [Aphelenchoides fujianensis]|nr:hypothetical protein M3Y99_00399100 [Aphelenchoides fujianensis]